MGLFKIKKKWIWQNNLWFFEIFLAFFFNIQLIIINIKKCQIFCFYNYYKYIDIIIINFIYIIILSYNENILLSQYFPKFFEKFVTESRTSGDICRICHMGSFSTIDENRTSRERQSQPIRRVESQTSTLSSYAYLGPLISACKWVYLHLPRFIHFADQISTHHAVVGINCIWLTSWIIVVFNLYTIQFLFNH